MRKSNPRTAMSAPSTTAPSQQVNVADLELPQLVEVKKQLEEVGTVLQLQPRFIALNPISASPGTLALDEFFRPTEAGASQVQVMHRKCKGDQAR